MNERQFSNRTKQLALRVILMVQALPTDYVASTIGRQVLRSGTSIGANYRAACRAKSTADMINKLKMVEEEADETLYWMELLVEGELVSLTRLSDLMNETNEVLAMIVASLKTLRARQAKEQ